MQTMKSIYFPPPVAEDMVRAILDGRKTVTRRVVKPQQRMVYFSGDLQDSGEDVYEGRPLYVLIAEDQNGGVVHIVPPYQPGDILYVRETFFEYNGHFYYKADGKHETLAKLGIAFKWRPSIHMPREAARIFLRVTGVRVDRLQDITDSDIIAEGVQSKKPEWMRLDFADTWNRTVKPSELALYGWEANPCVWVIGFERINREEALS